MFFIWLCRVSRSFLRPFRLVFPYLPEQLLFSFF
jgi:hypothetical protein